MRLARRSFAASAVAIAANGLSTPARAQDYPARPVRIVVPISAGSTTDVVARLVGEGLRAATGQPFVVENRPGAGGTIGTATVAKSAADGYTLLVASSAHTSNAALFASLPYDTLADFRGVTMLATLPNMLVSAPSRNFKSVADLVAQAKARPGALTYGSGGVGSAAHMNAEKFRAMASFEAVHVPYRGTPEVMADVVAGRVDFAFIPVVTALGAIREGKLAALACGTAKRSGLLPDVPTTVEAGVPGSAYNVWIGLFAPAGTPAPVLARLNEEVVKTLRAAETVQKLGSLGADVAPMTAAAFDAHVATELADIKELVRTAKIPTN